MGKTYAVQKAIDIINNNNYDNYANDNANYDNANYHNNNGHDDIVQLVSIRGSELLSGAAGGGGQHSAAAAAAAINAAKELYNIFEYSAKSMSSSSSSSSSSRPSCYFHRIRNSTGPSTTVQDV